MTPCSAMLDRMLEADLGELDGRGDTVLAAHLRECTTCRSVANRLLDDTRMLARSVPAAITVASGLARRPRRLRARRVGVTVLAAVAASSAAVVIRAAQHGHSRPAVATAVMQPVSVVPPFTLGSPLASQAGPVRVSRSRAPNDHGLGPRGRRFPLQREMPRAVVSVAVKVEPTVATPMERPVSAAPVRLDSGPRPSLGGGVAVDPPAGKRADIIRTDHPGITVVWLTTDVSPRMRARQ